MFGIDSLMRYICPQCRQIIFPSTTLVCSSVQFSAEWCTSNSTERSNRNSCSSFSGDRFSGFSCGRLVLPSYSLSSFPRVYNLNRCLYQSRPLHSGQHIYYELRIVIHFLCRQVHLCKLQRKCIWRRFARLGRTVQKIMCQQLHRLPNVTAYQDRSPGCDVGEDLSKMDKSGD